MFHPRNKHQGQYDLQGLIKAFPDLKRFVRPNKYGKESIDFFNPKAVKSLNTALLILQYGIKSWDIPDGQLCPPIPGRADYIHFVADLLAESWAGRIPTGQKVSCLDIGTGANCIYPLLGSSIYQWKFVGTDVQESSLSAAQKNLDANPDVKDKIRLRKQFHKNRIFAGVWKQDELFDLVICNPPFHASEKEAEKAQMRKLRNLKATDKQLNFGGNAEELWCEGGELGFLMRMIEESKAKEKACLWFTSLLSKEKHIPVLQRKLKKEQAKEIRIIPMGQGNKLSRLICWSFLELEQRNKWGKIKWE